MTISELLCTILCASSAFVVIASAIEKGILTAKSLKAPYREQSAMLDALEKRLCDAERKLARDNDRFSDTDESMRLTQMAILALLDHGIDGNNTEGLRRAKEQLQSYLIAR